MGVAVGNSLGSGVLGPLSVRSTLLQSFSGWLSTPGREPSERRLLVQRLGLGCGLQRDGALVAELLRMELLRAPAARMSCGGL